MSAAREAKSPGVQAACEAGQQFVDFVQGAYREVSRSYCCGLVWTPKWLANCCLSENNNMVLLVLTHPDFDLIAKLLQLNISSERWTLARWRETKHKMNQNDTNMRKKKTEILSSCKICWILIYLNGPSNYPKSLSRLHHVRRGRVSRVSLWRIMTFPARMCRWILASKFWASKGWTATSSWKGR